MMKMQFRKVSHVLFDLDGLLLDSEVLYTETFTKVCAKYGKIFTWEMKASLLGFQGHECADKITKTLDLPLTRDEFMAECQKEYEVLFPKAQLMPGAQRLVEHLHKKGVPIALATSSSQDSVDMKMQNHKELLSLFHHLTMGSSDPEVTKGKPDPAIFLVCASRFPDKPKPEDVLYTETFTKVCAKYGKIFTWEMKASLLGFQGHECADKITKTLDLPLTRDEFMAECQKEYEVLFPKAQLMPGAQRLVEHLHKKGVPIALATSSSQDSVDMKMQNHKELLSLFHHLTMGSSDPEVTKGKPDPAIFLVCASRFPDKPKPEDCLVFEDALNGVKAAVAAKMQVVCVPDPRIDSEELKNATLLLKSLEDFQPQLFGLPAYD